MAPFRYLTLVWPGLPWLWLRGSLMGLALALAFAVSLDIAVVATWIWPGLVELPFVLGLWTATAVIWLVSTVSAASAFPSAIPAVRAAEADALFARARDAYLARDWLRAETRLRELLDLAPTDGEAQLLLGTLLRRVGRKPEARQALEKLSRSDCGAAWRGAIAKELHRLAAGRPDDTDDDSVVLPLREESTAAHGRTAAA
ncbi:MAG: tetratricopeptide repeat protein [Planctomycetia bacterium]|nr:tetratricopeptide repeat protein [Planctomycetia bacterium]